MSKKIMMLALVLALAAAALMPLAACGAENAGTEDAVQAEPAEEFRDEGMPGMLTGGWQAAADPTVTEEMKAMVDQAMKVLDSHEFVPVTYLGSQVVAGTNHAFLGLGRATYINMTPIWEVAFIHVNLEGTAELMNVADFDFSALCTYGADEIAQMPEEGWVLDSLQGAAWQDDRASLEVFLEDTDNYKVLISWSSSASELTEWVYAGTYDAETQTLKAEYVVCDEVTFDEAGNETRKNVYEHDSEAVFSLNEEGKVLIQNAGDEALEGKTFEKIGNAEGAAQ